MMMGAEGTSEKVTDRPEQGTSGESRPDVNEMRDLRSDARSGKSPAGSDAKEYKESGIESEPAEPVDSLGQPVCRAEEDRYDFEEPATTDQDGHPVCIEREAGESTPEVEGMRDQRMDDRSEPQPSVRSGQDGNGENALDDIGDSLEAFGDVTSARWLWDPIMSQMEEWNRDLTAIGQIQGRTIEVSGTEAALIPIGAIFTVVHGLLGTCDLLARLNPANVALQSASRGFRDVAGTYSREEMERDMGAVGREAWGIASLGLIQACDHMRQGLAEGNTYLTTRATTEVVMAVEAAIGTVAGVRSLAADLRAAAAEGARPTIPEPGLDAALRATEPEVRASRGAGEAASASERTTETGPPTLREPGLDDALRATEPEARASEGGGDASAVPGRTTETGTPTLREPGRTTPSERPSEPGTPTLPESDVIYDRAAAQAGLERAYAEGPVPVEAMSHDTFVELWRSQDGGASGGDAVPYAYRLSNGEMIYDVTRLEDVSRVAQEAWLNRAVEGATRAREERVAAQMERLPRDVSPIERSIPDPIATRAEIDAALDRGQRPHIVTPSEAYEARWRAAGGGSVVHPGFVDQAGRMWVDGERMEGF
jgi:hypothetical protein